MADISKYANHYLIQKNSEVYVCDGKPYFNENVIEKLRDDEESISSSPNDLANSRAIALYRELLSKHFENLIVLTGAGTSCGIGKGQLVGLTMKAIWSKVIEVVGNEKILKTAHQMRFSVNDIYNINLEDFLSKASMYSQLYPQPKKSLFSKTIFMIESVIVQNCSIELPNNAPHAEFLKKLTSRKTRHSRLKIYTTNYDLLFEQTANTYGFSVIDGFSFTYPRYFNGNNFDYDFVLRKNSRINVKENYIGNVFHLYKLHGSLDWVMNTKTVRVEKCENYARVRPVMIFPERNKYENSYDQPFFEMMTRFQTDLRTENALLIIIGYSFGDKHINSMINEAIDTNHSIQIIVVDPYMYTFSDMIYRAENNPNITLIRSTFSEFTDNLPHAQVYETSLYSQKLEDSDDTI